MQQILCSVGRGGFNTPPDVAIVQRCLNKIIPEVNITNIGKIDTQTIIGIDYFQGRYLGIKPTGRVLPKDETLIALNRSASHSWTQADRLTLPERGSLRRLTQLDFEHAAKRLDCELATIKAMAKVESLGSGFLPDGRPKILFEAHLFARATHQRFNVDFPDISSKYWNRTLYTGGSGEYERLLKAMALDRKAALESTSWGAFQILGENYALCNFRNVEQMIAAMFLDEVHQLNAFVWFVTNRHIKTHLQKKDWARVAQLYNGKSYAENGYDLKLKATYEKFANVSAFHAL
ncbi:MAG TPA: N-acetylmuramidase family protein [Limnobacter sp.]|uniref:N-acetylmuramidase family protein n=1 Tax=Limnobacter sp. TaxID=2003368 RepID=UPI002E2EC981|nr:N-acetylmuramidase family protein [Limnobacter sp.]HEX5484447.1 N-acetylmuramidase family protein [Limnobacter sp.]